MEFLICAIVFAAGVYTGKYATERKLEKEGSGLRNTQQIEEKKENKEKILEYMRGNPKTQNDDIETLLDVSDSTATRYLNELEAEGKITQVHDAGPGIYYKLN